MTSDARAPRDPRDELRELAEALRAHVEWQSETGATGLPRSAKKKAAVAAAATEIVAPAEPARARAPHPPPAADAGAGVGDAGARIPVASSRSQVASGRTVAADPDARRLRLVELASEIRPCTRCELHRERTQTVFARGNPAAELCFVGEGPGADEDAQGEPFVGKAGQLLDRMIVAMGLSRDDVYVCNIVKCRPPDNRKPEPEEMAACVPYLHEQLELVAPKVIVALGATAVEGLLGSMGTGITRLRGNWKLYRGRVPVMPTFHPAYLLRNPPAKRDVWDDLKAVLRQLGKPIPKGGA